MKFQEVKICGVDIGEFSFYSVPENKSILERRNKIEDIFENLKEKIDDISGKEIARADEMAEGGHYIVVNLVSPIVNPYTVKFENGNVYLDGSFLSIDKAVEDFIALLPKKTGMSEADNKEGSLGLTVPYTKQDILDVMVEAYNRDDMLLPGTHTWGTGSGDNNGVDVQQTADRFTAIGCPVAPVFEVEVGKFTPFNPRQGVFGEEKLTDYDISKLVSEAFVHVANGGIISLCQHLGNPLNNGNGSWFNGRIGTDEKWDELMTDGTELNAGFRKSADGTIRVLKAFKANGIPIMFRPFHEQNGDWFWWCAVQGWMGPKRSKESMQKMWQWYYKMITEEVGFTDALWVYAPSAGGPSFIGDVQNMVEAIYSYPGDDYVDIVGVDWYGGGLNNGSYNTNGNYTDLMATGKPCGFCEIGPSAATKLDHPGVGLGYHYKYDCLDLLGEMKSALADGLKICYLATWTWHGSLTTIGRVKEFMADPMMVSREDLAERWKKIHG